MAPMKGTMAPTEAPAPMKVVMAAAEAPAGDNPDEISLAQEFLRGRLLHLRAAVGLSVRFSYT